MKGVHYCSLVHLALILREGQIQPSVHAGFDRKQISFCLEDSPVPAFLWDTRQGQPHPFTERGRARIYFDNPEGQRWDKTCREKELVRLTKIHQDTSRWMVRAVPVRLEDFRAAQVFLAQGWVNIESKTLEHLLEGFSVRIADAFTGTYKEVQF